MYIVILVTVKNRSEANKIVKKLVGDQLVACANIIGDVKSIFWWEGKVDQAKEVLLILKSKKSLFLKIKKAIKSLHSYSVPEIISLPIVDGNEDYLNWIKTSTIK